MLAFALARAARARLRALAHNIFLARSHKVLRDLFHAVYNLWNNVAFFLQLQSHVASRSEIYEVIIRGIRANHSPLLNTFPKIDISFPMNCLSICRFFFGFLGCNRSSISIGT